MSFAGDIGRMVARGPLRPLVGQETELLMYCSMMSEETQERQIEMYHTMLKASYILQIMDQRFRFHFGDEQPFSPSLMIWFSFLANGNPGNAILLLAVMKHMIEEKMDLTLGNAINHFFSEGVPNTMNYELAWRNQKYSPDQGWPNDSTCVTDNSLDRRKAWA